MKKVNTSEIVETSWDSPKGKFSSRDKEISIALGRDKASTDIQARHPFDVEICRIPPGKTVCPYHSHSAQWEFYHILSGTGKVRDREGLTAVSTGDAFLFKPGEAHTVINDGTVDLVMYVIADNPIGESCYYPDSKKWQVSSPEKQVIRSEPLEYIEGEE